MTIQLSRALAEEYSRKSQNYELLWSPVIRPMALPILAELPLKTARDVLDLGTGTGALLPDIAAAARSARIVGVDSAEGMVERSPRSHGRHLAVMDAERLALGSGVFDVVTMVFVLFHIADPMAALREAVRALRSNGAIGVVTWGKDADVPGLHLWEQELDASGAAPDQRDPKLMQQSRMDEPEKLILLLESAGFRDVVAFSKRFEYQWNAADLVKVQTACGIASRRLPSLSHERAVQCEGRVSARLSAMSPKDLLYRPEVIFAVGRKTQ